MLHNSTSCQFVTNQMQITSKKLYVVSTCNTDYNSRKSMPLKYIQIFPKSAHIFIPSYHFKVQDNGHLSRGLSTSVPDIYVQFNEASSPNKRVLAETLCPASSYNLLCWKGNSGEKTKMVERQKKEDHLSSIFMGYILVFLVCHCPRLVLNIYELAVIETAIKCMQ